MHINFDYKFFNPNFYWVMNAMNDESITYAFLYGGSSSGKTYSVVQAILIKVLIEGADAIIFKKTRSAITNSIYKDFVIAVKQLKLDSYFEIMANSVRCTNGAAIVFAGLDDPEKIKGIAGFKYIIFDEITEGTYEDFKQLSIRMRGIKNQKFIGMFNPVSEVHWIKEKLYDTLPLAQIDNSLDGTYKTKVIDVVRHDRYIWIRSSYLNNYYVSGCEEGWGFKDESAMKRFDELKFSDYNYYRVYALAEWGKISEGNEFYKNFRRDNHVEKLTIDHSLPLHISFDENVRPFFPMTVMQTSDKTIKVIDEIIGINPNNNYISVCKQFAKKYSDFKRNKIFLYGDATSKRADARTEKGYNLFQMIKEELTQLGFVDITVKVNNANPSVSMSGVYINRILAGVQKYTLLINEDCKNTIADFTYLKEDKDGGMLKEKAKDSDGYPCEKYGHCSDSVRYMLIKYLEEDFKLFMTKDKGKFEPVTVSWYDNKDFLQF